MIAVVVPLVYGCATAMDMDTNNSSIKNNTARIEKLEADNARQQSAPTGEVKKRLDSVDKDISSLKRSFADSKYSLDTLLERLESMQAYLQEVESYITQFRKKGGEMDKALEGMATKMEAEVRRLGEKVKEMMQEGE